MQLDFVSKRGDVLPLVNNKYFTLRADGLTAATTSISSNVIGGVDGDTVNNIQAQPRGIVFDLTMRPEADVEEAKREILRVVKLKQDGALIWIYKGRTITISGTVENITMPRFTESATMQFSLYCSQPFWEDVKAVVTQINEAIDLHYFTENNADMLYFPEEGIAFGEVDTIRTKTLYNAGDVDTGLEIMIVALDTVTNPIIYDGNGNFFGIGYETENIARTFVMQAGDTVVITTHKGNKNVKRNGVSLFEYIKPQSKWLQLGTGENTFTINANEESITNMNFNMSYKQRYV